MPAATVRAGPTLAPTVAVEAATIRLRLPSLPACGSRRAGDYDVLRLRTLGALFDVERHLVAFVQRTEAVGLDRREVDEDVGASVVLCDEAEALLAAEPLDLACCHFHPYRPGLKPGAP